MGDKLYNIVRALLAYLVCCHQVLSFNVAKSGETYVQAGSQTTLSCRWTPPTGIGPLRVNWRKGFSVIASAFTPNFTPQYPEASIRNRVTLGTLTSTSTSTSITLSGLQCPNDIAEYSCDITTDALQDDSGTASFNVNLFDFLGYNIAISSSPSRLQAGQHASLTCTASNIGRPPGIMKWYKADQEITTGFTQQTSINSDGCTYNGLSGLSILPTSQDDGVMYTCTVEPNSPAIGDSSKQGRYTLDIQYAVRQVPTVTSSTGTFTVEQGTTFTLNCQASGKPSTSYVWTRPDNTNSTGSQLVLTLSTTGTYVYTCFATNSLTTTPLSTYVTVTVQEKSSTSSTTTTSTTTSTTPVHVAVASMKTAHVAVGAGKLKGGEAHYSPEDVGVIVGTVVAEVIILLGAAVVLFVLYRRGILHSFWKNRQPGDTVDVDVTESNNEYALIDIKEIKSKEDTYTELRGKIPSLYIPPGRIRLDEKIGKGRISEVWKGEAIIRKKARTVAVKRLNDQSSQKDELVSSFEKEIQTMKALPPHPYIVMFYGSSQQNGVALMVLEFMSNGNLKQLLKNSRGTGQYSNLHGLSNTLTSQQLMRFAYQVASGMTHVAKHKLLHRDLATRTVLLDDQLTCKISDFGLSKDISQCREHEYNTMGLLPVRWMAPESLMDNLYTTKGDVWSFGVLLWEIVTLGCLPYPGIPGADLARMLHSGYRMGKPDHCTQQVYVIMQKCWQAEPGDRPSFEDLVQMLQSLAASEELYVDVSDFREDVYVNTAEIGQGEKC